MSYAELERAYNESQKELFNLRLEIDALRHGQQWYDISGSSWERAQSVPVEKEASIEKDETAQQATRIRSSCNHNQLELKAPGVVSGVSKRQNALKTQPQIDALLVTSALRQVKYELFCASVDVLGFSLHISPGRNCTVKSVYGLNDTSTAFEFVYDPRQHKYVDLLWSKSLERYASLYQYWVQENRCLQGFMASVLLEEFHRQGLPPARKAAPVSE